MTTPRAHRRRLPLGALSLLFLAGMPLAGPAPQGPLLDERGAPTLADRTTPRLKRALATFDAKRIRADVRFIASDDLAGRDTPSDGLRQAARYIENRLKRLGFTPGGDAGFFDEYELVRGSLDADRCTATIESASGQRRELAFGQDYYPARGGVRPFDVRGEVLFAGSGRAHELEDLRLRGRWVLTYEAEDVALQTLGAALERAGAAGHLVASPPQAADAHGPLEASVGVRSGHGRLRVCGPDFPTLYVGRATVAALTAGSRAPRPGDTFGTALHEVRVTRGEAPVRVENVAGLWPGSHPERSNEVLVVSAHYDHVGARGESIYNGADDNGSGTAGLMAIAEALTHFGPMERSVLLLWVSGEEKGLLGSKAWTLEPTLPEGMRAVCALNIDMIGRNAEDYLLITPTAQHPAYNGLTRMAERYAPLEGFPRLGSCDDYWRRSDHKNFSDELGIPVAFLFSDVHEDYHQPTDTWDKVDFQKIARVSRLVLRMLDALQGMDLSAL